jgi:protein phosphatase
MAGESIGIGVRPLAALRFAAGTDIGRRREENQDAHGVFESSTLRAFFVCDGMGGVQGGAIASNLAVATIGDLLKERRTITASDIAAAVAQANANIFERGAHEPGLAGMGTTCVGLVFVDDRMFIANVGDSRAYRIRDGVVTQLTEDHTLVRELVRSGALAPELAENHPVSHMLTRSLGPAPTVEVDCSLSSDGPLHGDRYLICCDGLYNMVGAEEFIEILDAFSLDDAVQEFIDLANARGGADNITLIVVEVGSDYPTASEQAVVAPLDALNGDHGGELPPGEGARSFEANGSAQSLEIESGSESYGGSVEGGDISGEEIAAETRGNEESHERTAETASTEAPHEDKLTTGDTGTKPSVRSAPSESAGTEPRTAAEEPSAARARPAEWLGTVGAFIGVLVVGFGIGYVYSHYDNFTPEGAAIYDRASEEELGLRGPAAPLVVTAAPPTPAGTFDSGVAGSTADAANRSERLEKRRGELRASIRSLNQKIGSFDQPISGRLGETLGSSTKAIDAIAAELESIRADIDVATRKLAVWYGRRKRLQETDPINLASEIAVVSPEVKARKEAFEQATWVYLKEAEVYRYNPTDRALGNRVAELGRARTESMGALVVAVRSTIENEVGFADKHIFELTIKRDEKSAEIDSLRREIDYVRILMGADASQRASKRAELMRERTLAEAELAGLDAILGSTESLSARP